MRKFRSPSSCIIGGPVVDSLDRTDCAIQIGVSVFIIRLLVLRFYAFPQTLFFLLFFIYVNDLLAQIQFYCYSV